MPPDSEHPLNGLLQALARKRREEAGDDFELHPATRRLLLAEVKRRFPKPRRAPGSWRLSLSRLWARTVSVVSLVVIVIMVGWALRTFWRGLPGVGDIALDEANPPPDLGFSLRKRPPEVADGRLAEDKSAELALPPLLANGPLPSRSGMVASTGAIMEATPAQPADEVAALAAEARRGAAAPRLADKSRTVVREPAYNPFSAPRAGSAGARSSAFNPVLDPTVATGGVVALTERLAKKSVGPTSPEKTVTAMAAVERPAAAPPTSAAPPVSVSTMPPPVAGPPRPEPQAAPTEARPPAGASAVAQATREKSTEVALRPGPAAIPTAPAPALRGADRLGTSVSQAPADAFFAAPATTAPPTALSTTALALVAPGPATERKRRAQDAAETSKTEGSLASTPATGWYFERVADAPPAQTRPPDAAPAAPADRKPMAERLASGHRYDEPLVRFQLVRDRQTIRLVDEDGSIYEGEVVADLTPGEGAKSTAARRSPARGAADVDPRYYFFRAAGTNRTFQQPVSVVATVSEEAPAPGTRPATSAPARRDGVTARARGPAPGKMAAPPGLDDSKAAALPPIRLRGSFRLGTNAEQDFKAIRTR